MERSISLFGATAENAVADATNNANIRNFMVDLVVGEDVRMSIVFTCDPDFNLDPSMQRVEAQLGSINLNPLLIYSSTTGQS